MESYLKWSVIIGLFGFCYSIDTQYMNEACNGSSVIDTTLLLETSKSLSYPPLMNCFHRVNVASGFKVHVSVERFELEEKMANACVDYLILYDGADQNAPILNSEVTCGKTAPENVTSSSNILTFYFKSDHSSALRGFAFVVTPVTDVPCSSSQLQCNNSLCIDASLKCDSYNQCGDKTDENDCQVIGSSKIDDSNTTLIIGLVIGITILIAIIIAIVINVYKNNKWKRFLNQHLEDPDVWNASPSYPVTQKYFTSGRGNYNTLSNENYNEVTLQPHSEESIHNSEI
ncbi:hypothetical protein LOTGIDRAFT_232182 [Lottia gigantea]|uniref:CUB domain-containing protein n=1 Tax=Lottia gigantea TaxID=225164 RepID=V4C0U3_LOTGI|nr:hypothetical protein LOTGIDRAFT_232182 [Lottia gigantea]ESO95074.1 hypothetical protein LOTGIDRAFT_232182 [Lottia gigantea]